MPNDMPEKVVNGLSVWVPASSGSGNVFLKTELLDHRAEFQWLKMLCVLKREEVSHSWEKNRGKSRIITYMSYGNFFLYLFHALP